MYTVGTVLEYYCSVGLCIYGGLLSNLWFLIRMAEFAEMHMPWNGIVASDSQSVLDTLFGHDELRRERDRDEPINLSGSTVILNCLLPDWDVLIEIQHALSQLPNIKLAYVRGHQDRHCSYHKLDEMGQLNVDADAKASEYQDAHGTARPLVLLSTTTHAHLLGPQGTVTGHYSEYLRYQATATPLKEYILKKCICVVGTNNGQHQLGSPPKGARKTAQAPSTLHETSL